MSEPKVGEKEMLATLDELEKRSGILHSTRVDAIRAAIEQGKPRVSGGFVKNYAFRMCTDVMVNVRLARLGNNQPEASVERILMDDIIGMLRELGHDVEVEE